MQPAIAESFPETKNAARMPLVGTSHFNRAAVAVVFRHPMIAADFMNLACYELRVVDAPFVLARKDENVFVRSQRPSIRAEKTDWHRLLPTQLIAQIQIG